MRISDYRFGSVTVDGTTYHRDVVILPSHVACPWWRVEGHTLSLTDLETVSGSDVRFLVIGTGAYGAMRVPPEVIQSLREQGLQVEVRPTGEAVEVFNRNADAGIAAALHLTC